MYLILLHINHGMEVTVAVWFPCVLDLFVSHIMHVIVTVIIVYSQIIFQIWKRFIKVTGLSEILVYSLDCLKDIMELLPGALLGVNSGVIPCV